MQVIKKYGVILSATPTGDTKSVKDRYDNAVKNNRKFNKRVCTFENVKTGNGRKFKIYNKGLLVRELYCLNDRYGIEFGFVDYGETNVR